MKLVSIKCPECDAALDISINRKECFCSYCGNKIILDDGSSTITHIYIDKTRERELDLEYTKLANERHQKKTQSRKGSISFIAVCVAIILICITFCVLKNDFNITFNFCIMLTCFMLSVIKNFRKLSYIKIAIMSLLLSAACIIFIILRGDFNSTFTVTIAIVLLSYFISKNS